MIRSIFWYINFVLSLIVRIPVMLRYNRLTKAAEPGRYVDDVNAVVKKWAMSHIRLSGATFDIKGIENVPAQGSIVFVANHQSNFDIAVFMCFVPRSKGYLAKVEMLKVPLLRTWMKHLMCVFLDRNDMRKSAKAINDCIALIKNGYPMVIFPEGTRSKSGELGEFKAGSFKVATKTKTPIVPVSIKGTRDIMENNRYMIKPAHVTITIHAPVYTEDLSKDEQNALPERTKEIIKSGL